MSSTTKPVLRRIASDKRGAVAIYVGLFATVLMGFGGAAVDLARWYNAKRLTAAALDAAVLAGARALQLDPTDASSAITIAQAYYDNNVSKRFPLLTDSVQFSIADSSRAVVATGTATIKTTLLGAIGISDLPIVNTTGVIAKASISVGGNGGSNVEVAVMLDVTGSMCDDGIGPCTSGTKIDGLKSAARDLVNIVVSSDQTKYTSKVALVPFSTRVRLAPDGAGSSIMKAVTNLDATWSGYIQLCTSETGSSGSENNGNWTCNQSQTVQVSNWKIMPCVTDRFYDDSRGMETTDALPAGGIWLNAHGGDRMPVSTDSSSTTPTTYRGLTAADPSYNWNYTPAGDCADVAPGNEVMPLSADKTSLNGRVDTLSAYGSTSGALGTSWAWYMLSPNWSSVWTGPSQPAPYSDLTTLQANGAPRLRKVAVLMTDGGYNTWRGYKGQDQQAVSNYAKTLCANMKAQGIEVYTVGFALDQLSAAERTVAVDTLSTCGTDIKHFYQTLTVPELKAAFRDIAVRMTALYLSK